MHKIELTDSRINELNDEERIIYCLERLSVQMNMSGLKNFFDYSIVYLYEDIIKSLNNVGEQQISYNLQQAKRAIYGDIVMNKENIDGFDDTAQAESMASYDKSRVEANERALQWLMDNDIEESDMTPEQLSEYEKVKEFLFSEAAMDEESKLANDKERPLVEDALKLLNNYDLEEEFHKIYHQYVLSVFQNGGYELVDV